MAFCTAITSTCTVAPMPTPNTSRYSEASPVLVDGPRCDSRYRPTVKVAVPTTGKILYRPHLLISCPVPMEVASRPTISGSRCRPEIVGLTPRTICRYCGRYVSAPNIAKPTTKPIAEAAVNTGCLNRCSGSTGSAAPRSATTQPAVNTTARTASVMMGPDPHG